MYVCVCNAVTCKRVKQALHQGKHSVRDLRLHFGFESCCGKCNRHMRSMIDEHRQAMVNIAAGNLHAR